MGKEIAKRQRATFENGARAEDPSEEDEITPAPSSTSQEVRNGSRRARAVGIRRRVRFADGPQEEAASVGDGIQTASGNSEGDAPLADMTGAAGTPAHSLLDEGNGAGVTAFDLTEELGEGGRFDRSNDDGVIPAALQRVVHTEAEDLADYSTDDDEERRPARAIPAAERDSWADAMENQAPAADPRALESDAVHAAGPNSKRRRGAAQQTNSGSTIVSRPSAVMQLVELLQDGESGAKAIARLKLQEREVDLGKVTDACHALLGHGVFSVYDLSRGEVLAAVQWDLMWGATPSPSRKIYGPFDAASMRNWERARYFSQKGKTAWVRPHGSQHIQWKGARSIFGFRPDSTA